MICIDVKNGIYVTPKYDHSRVFPIHVIKSTNPPKIDCEEEKCRQFMRIAWSSGNPGKECIHLERTNRGKPYTKPAVLTSTSLQDMLSKGLMSSEWGVKCEELNNAAKNLGVDSVFPVYFKDEGYSEQWHFFSVFTNETDNWCQFGRTRVTFDAVAGKWNCQCRGTGKSHRCIHCMMGMWRIFQESPGTLVATTDIQVEDIDDLESHMFESNITCEPHNVNTQKICVMTEYLLNHKRIPCLQEVPLDLRTQEKQPPPCFIPTENTCSYCPGPTPPALNPSTILTTQAMVYGVNYVKKEGSIADMLNRLQELLNFKDVYPKLFVKLQKAGGGVFHFSCVHGVVYYLNFLFWTESARDHADGLLSFKYLPTCYISDVAGQVARHTNNRTKQLFFKDNDGRLCAPTSDNVQRATKKELVVDPQWVKNLRSPLPLQEEPDSDRMSAKHPITGTNERYSLYDRFHQSNQKHPEEKLRSLNICPTLRTQVNSAVAEQFNRELAAVKYSLCQMSEPHFKQTVRVMIGLHNEKINNSFKAEMEALCNTQLCIGVRGILGLQSAETSSDFQAAFKTVTYPSQWKQQDSVNCGVFVCSRDDVLESVKADQILTDGDIKDLERDLVSGHLLSNRMYLYKHRGFDPVLQKHYNEHFSLFSDTKTEEIMERLEKILSVPGPEVEKQQFLSQVILPESCRDHNRGHRKLRRIC
ncbi:hypothetical protein ABVT39_015981 [Epinephelus coioides]